MTESAASSSQWGGIRSQHALHGSHKQSGEMYTVYIYTVCIHISCINSHVPITIQVSWKVKCVMFMCLVISSVQAPKGLSVLSHSMVILTEPANKIQARRQIINQEIVSMFLFLQNWHFLSNKTRAIYSYIAIYHIWPNNHVINVHYYRSQVTKLG